MIICNEHGILGNVYFSLLVVYFVHVMIAYEITYCILNAKAFRYSLFITNLKSIGEIHFYGIIRINKSRYTRIR